MSANDASRPCVVHGCERRGDQQRVIRLGGKDVDAGFCALHAPGEAAAPGATAEGGSAEGG
jgi:hypothetical protein